MRKTAPAGLPGRLRCFLGVSGGGGSKRSPCEGGAIRAVEDAGPYVREDKGRRGVAERSEF